MVNEKQKFILFTLQQLDESVEREGLFERIKRMQEQNGAKVFEIEQRTKTHFYCEELGIELQKLVFMGLVSLDTKWNGEYFEQFYSLTPYGREILQHKIVEKENSLEMSKITKNNSRIEKEVS